VAVCDELRRRGLLHGTINVADHPARPVRAVGRAAAQLYYPRSGGVTWSPPYRFFRAAGMRGAYKQSGATHVLHMPIYQHLPMVRPEPGVRHYLYTDHTFHFLSAGPARIRDRYSDRLCRDVERAERKAFGQLTHIFPISEFLRDQMAGHYGVPPEKMTVVGTGRGQMEPYHGPKDYSKGLLLFVAKGRIEDKGAPLAVEAFKLARRRHPHLRLVMLGDPRYLDLVKGVDGAEAHSFVAREQLLQFFHDSALFVMPANREGWGFVYLEALSCRTPIVGLNHGAIPELTGHGRFGFIAPDDTPQTLADTIAEALRDPARLARMGAEGQAYVTSTFTWENVVKKMTDVMLA
jgi:glycosyltransferase involved in cell wall biosynthesis